MKMINKKLACMILSVFLLVSAMPLTVHAAATTHNVSSAEELSAACAEINENGGEHTINLTKDIEGGCIDIDKGDAIVTVIGNGYTLSATVSAVIVSNGATVNLGDGNSELFLTSDDNNDDPGIVHVWDAGSVCNMYEGVTLSDHKGNNYYGGGVTVEGGIFHMYGGTIENCGIDGGSVCYGGGVAAAFGGQFIMDGGIIKDCYVTSDILNEKDENNNPLELNQNVTYVAGGGVFAYCGGSFVMNGGSIESCTATCTEDYPAVGGGVAAITSKHSYDTHNTGEITPYGYFDACIRINDGISAGTISGCTADLGGAVGAGRYYSLLRPIAADIPETSPNPNMQEINISGGTISGNTARILGGGVYLNFIRQATSIYNLTLTNNEAPEGGALCIDSFWTNATLTDCTMNGNSATNGKGGAVYLNGGKDSNSVYTELTIGDCDIENNSATDKGGGIYYKSDSKLQIQGANTIQNNKVGEKDNNLYFLGTDYPVYVSGSLSGSQIGITDAALWEDDKEDTAEDAESSLRLTEGFKSNNVSLIPANAFTSDHESWVVDFGELITKTVASEDDFYTYNARKYNVESRTDSGESCSGEIYTVKANTFTEGVAENPGVFYDEVLSRFGSDKYDNYGSSTDGNGYLWHYFLNKTTENMVYVVFTNQYNVQILSADKGGTVLISSTGHQTQYAQSGTFAYQYGSKATRDTIVYSDDYETIEYHYGELLDEDMIIYDYDELGHIISKTEVDKTPTKTPHQETIIELRYDNEVRLVRKTTVDYHINNRTIAKDKYNGNDIFTSYVAEATGKPVTVGDTINAFYTVPEVTPTAQNSCPYIFKGWYYDKANNNDTHPVDFGTDIYEAGRDIYAHWIEVKDVAKDRKDEYNLPEGETAYGGFDLTGVQVRGAINDTNFDGIRKPGGLRFMTSLSTDVVNEIKALQDGDNNIEYGYVAATRADWITAHQNHGDKLQYVDSEANGKNTTDSTKPQDYFGFASNVVCTSQIINESNGVVIEDHRNFDKYLLYTLVITYKNGEGYDRNVLARPYIRYTDANGLDRVAYSEYRGRSNTLGGCYTSYNANVEAPEQEG